MTTALEIKEKIKSIYAEYAYAINMVLRFLLAFAMFLYINKSIGYLGILNSIFPILFFALICSILSVKSAAVFSAILILAHSYALGLEVLGISAVLFLLFILFFLRFDESDCVGLLMVPLAFSIGIPAVVPICFGLKGKTSSIFSIGCGTIGYYYVQLLSEKAPVLQHTETADMLNNLRLLVDGLLQNKMMFLSTAAMILVLLLVYCIRRLSLDYIWQIAVGVGAAVYLTVMISGGLFLDARVSVLGLVLGTVVSCLIAFVVQFFILSVDYTRTERMEFEDDEYYYYVKAVPKVTITQAQREIKTIVAEDLEEQDETEDEIEDAEEKTVESVSEDDIYMEAENVPAYEPVVDEEALPELERMLEESLNDL